MSRHIILAMVLLFSQSVFTSEVLDCGPPTSFEVDLENGQKAIVYDAEIKVDYDRNELAVYEYPNFDAVNILMNNTFITFSGHIVDENEEIDPKASKTVRMFNSKIAGTAKLVKDDSGKNSLVNCDLYLGLKRNEEELNIPKKVQVEIIHEAAACVKSTICQKLGSITNEDIMKAITHPYAFGSLSVPSKIARDEEHVRTKVLKSESKPKITEAEIKALLDAYQKSDSNNVNNYDLQSTVNKLVDLAISQLVKMLEKENQGKIKIPDLSQNFSTGSSWWKTTGEFNAYDGSFEDLTTISRTDNASLKRTGLKFIASCGFRLGKANMEYKRYKLRYGIIKVNGELSASIDGVGLFAAAGVDYNQKPCRTVLEEVRISELGKVKIKITGLGPLNKLLSKLVTWITKKWQEDIVNKIESKLRDTIVKNLNKFDCEKYRP